MHIEGARLIVEAKPITWDPKPSSSFLLDFIEMDISISAIHEKESCLELDLSVKKDGTIRVYNQWKLIYGCWHSINIKLSIVLFVGDNWPLGWLSIMPFATLRRARKLLLCILLNCGGGRHFLFYLFFKCASCWYFIIFFY